MADACFVLGWMLSGPDLAEVTNLGANTVLDRFDGHRMVAAGGPPLQARGDGVDTMSCPTTRFCMAIGLTRPAGRVAPTAEVWNGERWRIVPVPLGPRTGMTIPGTQAAEASDVELRSVSCASARMCVAVGTSYSGGTAQNDIGVIRQWDGNHWVIDHPAIAHDDFDSVSCGSPHFCAVAGAAKHAFTIPEIYRGDRWTAVRLPRIAGGGTQGLAGVSCPTPTRCVGVGSAAVIVRFHGQLTPTRTALVADYHLGHWTAQRLPLAPGIKTQQSPGADGLAIVSCAPRVTIACTARGGSASPTAAPGTINSPTGGQDLAHLDSAGWTQSKTVLLHDLACASSTLCFAPAAAGGRLDLFHYTP